MPYYVEKSGKTWRLAWRFGKSESRNVSKDSEEARQAGFTSTMSREEATARATQLKAESWVHREAQKEGKRAKLRERDKKLRSAFLTDADAAEFERVYCKEYKIQPTHWSTMQKIIVAVKLHPSDWFPQRSQLFEQFAQRGYSANYAKKLLRYLNFWGFFLCAKQKRAFMKVPGLDGAWRNRLERGRKFGARPSRPLSPALLESKKREMPEENYQWLFVSVWFGLRPREIDTLNLKNRGRLWDVQTHKKHGQVLSVFQEKLEERGVAKEHCWKRLPAFFPEQRKAIQFVLEGKLRKPVGARGRFMANVFGEGFSFYAGRNNFSGMLRDEGFDQETRRRLMGHQSVVMTEKYDRKTEADEVFFTPPSKKRA